MKITKTVGNSCGFFVASFFVSYSSETVCLYTFSSSTVTLTDTVPGFLTSPFSSFSCLYPVNDFTFTLTVPSFISWILFTVNVIADPSSTTLPTSKLCFNTIPLDLVVSSEYVIFTSNFFAHC